MKREDILEILWQHRGEMQAFRWSPDEIEDHWIAVANEAETAFALISCDVYDGTPIELELFLVLPEARGQGVGTVFLHELVRTYGSLGGEFYTEAQGRFYRKAGSAVWHYSSVSKYGRFSLSRSSLRPAPQ